MNDEQNEKDEEIKKDYIRASEEILEIFKNNKKEKNEEDRDDER